MASTGGGGKIQNTKKEHLKRSRMVQISAPYMQSEKILFYIQVYGEMALKNAQFI